MPRLLSFGSRHETSSELCVLNVRTVRVFCELALLARVCGRFSCDPESACRLSRFLTIAVKMCVDSPSSMKQNGSCNVAIVASTVTCPGQTKTNGRFRSAPAPTAPWKPRKELRKDCVPTLQLCLAFGRSSTFA